MAEHTPSEAIAAYFLFKAALDQMKKKTAAEEAKYENAMDEIKKFVRKHLTDAGLDSVRAKGGIAFFKKVDFVSVGDWDMFRTFLSEGLAYELGQPDLKDKIFNSAMWDFLNQAVSKSQVKAFMEKHKNVAPPGIKYDASREIFINAR